MPQQLRVSRELNASGATLIGVGNPTLVGKVIYVDSDGSDGYDGLNYNYPKKTIQSAIDACTNKAHDYIFVIESYQADTTVISINKSWMHLIGLTNGSNLGSNARVDMQGTDAAFKTYTEAEGFELAGFQIGSSGDACIELATTSFDAHIHHCGFGHYIACKYGIFGDVAVASPGSWLIDHNYFGQYTTHNHIYLTGSSFTCYNDNYFEMASSSQTGIFIGGGFGTVFDNRFFAPIALALSKGWAIRTEGRDEMIDGNVASQTGDGTGENPYRDDSSASAATCLNGWGMNYDGVAVTSPSPQGG